MILTIMKIRLNPSEKLLIQKQSTTNLAMWHLCCKWEEKTVQSLWGLLDFSKNFSSLQLPMLKHLLTFAQRFRL